MPPPSVPPGTPPANADGSSGVQIQEIPEGDEEVEEVEDEEEHGSTVGSGVGAFLAPQRKKTVKKTFLKKPSAKNAAVKPETRSSVFAEAGTLSARELTRLIEECSALAQQKEDEELAEGVPRELSVTVEDNTQLSFVWVAISVVRAKETMKTKTLFDSSFCTGPDRCLAGCSPKLEGICFWRPGFSFHFFGGLLTNPFLDGWSVVLKNHGLDSALPCVILGPFNICYVLVVAGHALASSLLEASILLALLAATLPTRAGAVSTSSARSWRARGACDHCRIEARTFCLRRSSCWVCWSSVLRVDGGRLAPPAGGA